MSNNIEENISELVSILSAVNCPSIIRSDEWWIEELLFKPGKPRTDLIVWIILKSGVRSGSFSSTLQDLDCTNVSTASSGHKQLESDEGIKKSSSKHFILILIQFLIMLLAIHDFLCTVGVCTGKDLSFVKVNSTQFEYVAM